MEFTLEQIQAAHAKVKSGADFPAYVQELKRFGMLYYDNYVSDGHTEYYGAGNYHLTGPAKYDTLTVAEESDKDGFNDVIKLHQDGGTDYATFCRQAAEKGIEKWRVDLRLMTCTYYDKHGNTIIIEAIPESDK